MAIIKTVFDGMTAAQKSANMLAFLQANKTGYFDSVTADANGNISCYVGEICALKFGFDGSTKDIGFTLSNGVSVSSYTANPTAWAYGIKADGGIFLYNVPSSNPTGVKLFIGRSDADTLAFAVTAAISSSSIRAFTIDFEGTGVFPILASGTFAELAGKVSTERAATSLCPLALDLETQRYTPKLFFVPFSQYQGQMCELTLGGKSYFYDGIFAMEG